MQRKLSDLNPGESSKVISIKGKGPLKRRLMDMGVTKGTQVYVRKRAPLGDPIEITVKGYELTLRKEDAERIIMQ
ncbi:MAG: FeoA family protein [Clostridia bacterium]|nr:FeoA family protein [Clostridia bacterium]